MHESIRSLSSLVSVNFDSFFKNKRESLLLLANTQLKLNKHRSLSPRFFSSTAYSKQPMVMALPCLGVIQKSWYSFLFRCGFDPRQTKRQKVVVLGTGWGSMNFIQKIDVTKYDVVIVSPRNYFSFTPLLPSVCSGVLTPRSCMEPVRNKLFRGGKKVMDFYEAWATEMDPAQKTLKCKSLTGQQFSIPYDYLVLGVGAEINTFGIPGVEEFAYYLKEVSQAKQIHKRILDCFEQASLPSVPVEQKKKLLHFIMIGGGPSGVETAAEVADLVKADVEKHFPQLIPYIQVTLIEMLPRVLPAFATGVSAFTLDSLKKCGIDVKLTCRVTKITKDAVHVVNQSGETKELPYGMVLWASGVGQVPFAKHILSTVNAQKSNRVIKVNEKLQILGMPACYGYGDCTWLTPKHLSKNADELFEKAKKSGRVSAEFIKKSLKKLAKEYPQVTVYDLSQLPKAPALTKEEFTHMLNEIDGKYSPPPPTAQAAAQGANYLAAVFNSCVDEASKHKAPAYNYKWKGQMSYVGGGNSVIQTPMGLWLGGITSHLMWKMVYCTRQMSLTNRFLCIMDWTRTALKGREVAREHTEDICLPGPPSN